jgi:uncharacterized protein (DUF58 family)
VTPIPSKAAVVLFTGCASMLAIAILALSPTAMLLSSASFLVLAAALALTVPIGGHLRRERLEFAWWVAHADPNRPAAPIVPETPFVVRCYIRWRGNRALQICSLYPIMPDGIELTDSDAGDLLLPPGTRTEFNLNLIAAAPGRFVMQGLSVLVPGTLGLFHAPLYFPNPVAVNVLPRSSIKLSRIPQTITGQHTDRCGQSLPRRHGDGIELRELREFIPGDPFKSIAWVASAHAGKLLVREVEQEVQETATIVLDVSGSMRAGHPGRRKLDIAIEIATSHSRRAIEAGDRMGLIAVDGRLLSHLAPAEGSQQLLRIYDALLAVTEVVDADLTEEDEQQLIAIVGKYLWRQEGVDFTSPDGFRKSDLVAYVGRIIRADSEGYLNLQVRDDDAACAQLRRFCRMRGIPLQYRSTTPGEVKAEGLVRALNRAGGGTRMPQSITVITDLDGILNFDTLIKTLKALRTRGQAISLIIPDARSLAGEATRDLDRDLQSIYGMQERRRYEETRFTLGKLGIPLLLFKRQGAHFDFKSNLGAYRRMV